MSGVTDAQVEAACAAAVPDDGWRDCADAIRPRIRDAQRRAIEAAERAAWSDDMGAAPREGTDVLILCDDGVMFVGPVPDNSGFEIVAWRRLPGAPR